MLTQPDLPIRADLDLTSLALQIARDPDRWLPVVRFDEQERWYTRLTVADDREVWLLTWLPGQRTEIHDHGGSAGAFAVAQGVLTETTVHAPVDAILPGSQVSVSRNEIRSGEVRGFGAHHIHGVTNESDTPAVSVHVYAPSLSTMSRYRVDDGTLRLLASERAGADW
ncbi:MAG TPA: cysteine dioxygenase family protein [Rhodococcus sp. (in: high G+C Gram-positive bacteria)]|jgi:predicted metal-dependent enzyme (double-stranded beta helix superfamily)|nr:cysteine dioxygenase family protein [Rhodococcus sp. (in: high G+C Gram-positive bacteria)]